LIRSLVFWFSLSSVAVAQTGQSPIVADPPKDVSIPNIINSFAAKETAFKQALEQYTYTRDVIMKANCQGSQEFYHLTVDVGFDRRGNRVEKVKAEQTTLRCIMVSKEDLNSFRDQTVPVLTTDEIHNYQISFVGQQHQDDVDFYVFDASPTAATSGKLYFKGRIWVDAHDFSIVKSQGTVVPQREKKHQQENIIPSMTTWRTQIDGSYWFPMQSRARGVLHFSSGDVEIDEVIRLTDYKAVAHP
jgi:hypothetical protein